MVNPNGFYTYAYLRKDRTPYYIGKGIRYRIYSTHRKGIKPPKDKLRIIFLKQNLTEEEAFKHEKYMIAVFGRKDLGTGILHNKTDGGDGFSGAIRSEKTRKKLSELNKGKNNPNYGKSFSEEHRRKMSEAHKGKVLSEEHRRKVSEAKTGSNNPNYGKKGKNHPTYGRSHSKEAREKLSKTFKGLKWWNDSNGNNKRSIECPGEGWVPGMTKRVRVS